MYANRLEALALFPTVVAADSSNSTAIAPAFGSNCAGPATRLSLSGDLVMQ